MLNKLHITRNSNHNHGIDEPLMSSPTWASRALQAVTRYLPPEVRHDGNKATKILTWNCQGAYRKKAEHIASIRPDIAVIQECEPLDKLVFPAGDVQPTTQMWFGEGKKGIGIFSYTDYTFELLEEYDPSIQHCIPLRVASGGRNFHLIAVWTKVDPGRRWSYFGQVYLALQRYRDFLHGHDSFLIGDFNWNAIWDKPNSVTNLVSFTQEMHKAQMTSYYHHYFGESFGRESRDTFFMHRKLNRGFHIDYCFGPVGWLKHLRRVRVGGKKTWLSQSDHCPLIVELALPACVLATGFE